MDEGFGGRSMDAEHAEDEDPSFMEEILHHKMALYFMIFFGVISCILISCLFRFIWKKYVRKCCLFRWIRGRRRIQDVR